MIEVVSLWVVRTTNVDDADRPIGQVFIRRLTTLDRNPMQFCQQTTGKEIVFVGSARMGHNQLDGHEAALVRFGFKFETRKHKNIPAKRSDGMCVLV